MSYLPAARVIDGAGNWRRVAFVGTVRTTHKVEPHRELSFFETAPPSLRVFVSHTRCVKICLPFGANDGAIVRVYTRERLQALPRRLIGELWHEAQRCLARKRR